MISRRLYQKLRRTACATSNKLFAKTYLPKHFSKPFAKLHLDLFNLADKKIDYAVLAAPREHGKSTTCSLSIPLKHICFGTKKYIVLIGSSETLAKQDLATIKEEIESNEKIIEDFGNLQGTKWSEKEIITSNNIKIVAIGSHEKIRGQKKGENRPDLIIANDIEDDEHVISKYQRNKLEMWFDRAILNLGGDDCDYMLIGTILHFDSLIVRKLILSQENKNIYGKKYSAIENNKPIWPEKWPMEKLIDKKEKIGSYAFESEFQNNPIDPENQIFKTEWLQYFDPTKYDIYAHNVYAGMDLSVPLETNKSAKNTDWTVLVNIFLDNDGKIYIFSIDRQRCTLNTQLSIPMKSYENYKHNKIGVEQVAYQRAFKHLLNQESQKIRQYIPITGINNTKNKESRIGSLQPLFENGTILINKNMKNYNEFENEYLQFPNAEHDDILDALEMAVAVARKSRINIRALC